jgi:hypothetical protein
MNLDCVRDEPRGRANVPIMQEAIRTDDPIDRDPKITPYPWVHPDEDDRGRCKKIRLELWRCFIDGPTGAHNACIV